MAIKNGSNKNGGENGAAKKWRREWRGNKNGGEKLKNEEHHGNQNSENQSGETAITTAREKCKV